MSARARGIMRRLIQAGIGLGLIGLAPLLAARAVGFFDAPPLYLPLVRRDATLTPTAAPSPTNTPAPALTPTPIPYAAGYALNGSFEAADNGTGSGTANWQPWWAEIPNPNDGSYNYAYRPETPNQECLSKGAAGQFVLAGDCAQRVILNWQPWWAGVKELAAVPAGAPLTLTAYGRAWAAANPFPAPSDSSVNVKLQVGIEPNGNCDPFAPSVVWSAPIAPHETWLPATVSAPAGPAGQVCVFLSTDYRGYSRQFLAGFWDAVSLTSP